MLQLTQSYPSHVFIGQALSHIIQFNGWGMKIFMELFFFRNKGKGNIKLNMLFTYIPTFEVLGTVQLMKK